MIMLHAQGDGKPLPLKYVDNCELDVAV